MVDVERKWDCKAALSSSSALFVLSAFLGKRGMMFSSLVQI